MNNAYRGELEEAGLVFSGTSPDGGLVEFVELPATSTRTTCRPRRTRSSCPARTARTRCSPGWCGAAVDAQRSARLVEVDRPREQVPAGT